MSAQEFNPEQVVFPITDFKPDIERLSPLEVKFATGFCFDPDCRFVGTNYHTAKLMGRHVRIKGVFSAHLYLDSAPSDVGAQDVHIPGEGSLRYTPSHDLAIYEMRRPLKHMHGISFDTNNLKTEHEVDIYGYPVHREPEEEVGLLARQVHGTHSAGPARFQLRRGRARAGASGAIVVDTQTRKILGVYSGHPSGKDRVILAVPAKEISDFVRRAQPYLQAALFPETVFISPVAADLYPPYAWPSTNGLPLRIALSKGWPNRYPLQQPA